MSVIFILDSLTQNHSSHISLNAKEFHYIHGLHVQTVHWHTDSDVRLPSQQYTCIQRWNNVPQAAMCALGSPYQAYTRCTAFRCLPCQLHIYWSIFLCNANACKESLNDYELLKQMSFRAILHEQQWNWYFFCCAVVHNVNDNHLLRQWLTYKCTSCQSQQQVLARCKLQNTAQTWCTYSYMHLVQVHHLVLWTTYSKIRLM